MSVLRNSRPIRYSYNVYQHCPIPVKAASIIVYGLKCFLSLSRRRAGKQHLLYFASYPNERRVLRHVRRNLQVNPYGEISISLRNCFRIAMAAEVLAFVPSIARLYGFANRLVKKYEFMPACRIFSTVTYYMRFKRLLDEDVKAVFIACQYSPECLGLAAAAHRAGKKVLFTNHASATGETGYVAPLHADLVAVTSQAIADLYQRHTPHDLNIIPFTISEPQQPLQLMGRDAESLTLGIYLTALTNETRLQEIVADWSRIPSIRSLFIRTHPAQVVNADLSAITGSRVPVEISNARPLSDDVERTDIAVCGNSAVTIEILRGGKPVLYDHRLDNLVFDYNGYLDYGIVPPHPETINEDIFEQIRRHYRGASWKEKMRYFDIGYQVDERAIVLQFAAAVDRVMEQV